MGFSLASIGQGLKRLGQDVVAAPAAVAHTVNNDVVAPVQRDVIQPVQTAARDTGGAIATTNRFLNTAGTGVQRSIIGTGQGLSGLTDLATPGTGTNRVSDYLNRSAHNIDITGHKSPFPAAYKIGQGTGDLATFSGGGEIASALKGTAKSIPIVAKTASVIPKVDNPLVKAGENLATKGFGGRVAGGALKNAAKPSYQAANAAFTALQTGKNASQGKKTTPLSVGTNLAIGGVGLPAAGSIAHETAGPLLNAAVSNLRDAHIVPPSRLSPSEVTDLSNYRQQAGTGAISHPSVYVKGVAAAQKAGIDYRDPNAIDNLLGAHRTYDTILQQRIQSLKNAKDKTVDFTQAHPIGLTGKAVDDEGKPISVFGTKNGASQPKLATQSPGEAGLSPLPPEIRIRLKGDEGALPNSKLAIQPKQDISLSNDPNVDKLIHYSTQPLKMNDTGNFYTDLESNIKKTRGNYEANRILTQNTIKAAQRAMNANPDDFEAAYHHAEDPTVPLTPRQQHLFIKYVQPLRDSITQGTNDLRGTEFEGTDTHIPRIALGKNSNLEQFLTGDRGTPTEGLLRKTADAANKKRTMYSMVDENGNRTVVSIKSPKDELGKSTGGKRVTAFRNGENEDLGNFSTKTNQDLMDRELKPAQNRLQNIAREVKALQNVKTRGGVSEARMKALSDRAAQLQFVKDEGNNLTVAERRSLHDATIKFKEAAKVKPTVTNVNGRLDTLGRHSTDLLNKVNEVTSKYDPENLKDKVFTDKNGKRYTIDDATTKEIETNTNVKYLHNPVITSTLAHTNIRNAINANEFNEWLRLHPDFASHAVKVGEGEIPDGWKPVDSPYFRGYYFDPKTAKIIDNQFGHSAMSTGPIARAWNGLTSAAVQFIVINPAIHGANLYQLASEAVGGANPLLAAGRFAEMNKNVGRMMTDSGYRESAVQEYLRDGGHAESYGSDRPTFISRALDKANVPEINKANAKAMAGIEIILRAASHESNLDAGMDAAESVKRIDTFMGSKEHISDTARAIGMFYHYLTTLTKGTGQLVTHPLKNAGASTNFILGASVLMGGNYVLQKFSGNPNAHFRNPGEIGFIHDLTKVPTELKNREVPTIVSSHINPLISAGINQAAGKDLGTGQKLDTDKSRAINLIQKTVAPVAPSMKINNKKSTPSEYIANEAFGIYLSHATGAPAATKGPLQILNTKGAKTDTTPVKNGSSYVDPTGYQQEQQYFKGKDVIDKQLAGDPRAQDAANNFLNRDKTPEGKTILLSPAETVANWASVDGNTKSLEALYQFYHSQPGHNPEWNLNGNGTINNQPVQKLQIWATYKSLAPGDLQRTVIAQQNPWINDTEQAIGVWANQLPPSNAVHANGYIPYPTVDNATQDKMNQITQLSSIPAGQRSTDQINQLSGLENDQNVQSAYNAQQQYTNAVRNQMHLPAIQYAPNASPDVQNFQNQYFAADSGTKSGLKSTYPQLYNQMEAALESQQLDALNKQGGLGYYGGDQSNSYLGDIYNVGKYDITPQTNANGTKSYNLTDFTGGGGTGQNGLQTTSASNAQAASGSGSGKKVKIYKRYTKPIRVYHAKKEYHSRSTKLKTPNANIKFAKKKDYVLSSTDKLKSGA